MTRIGRLARLLGWTVGRGATALPAALLVALAVSLGAAITGGWSSPVAVLLSAVPATLAALVLARALAVWQRKWAAKVLDTPIPRPYLASADRRWWARPLSAGRDPATWRDVAWLLASGPVGLVPIAVLATGLTAIVAGVFWDPGPIGRLYGLPLRVGQVSAFLGIAEGWVLGLAGVIMLVLWRVIARPLRETDARIARALLAPTERSRLALRVRELAESRADTVDAQAAELRRIERDLHDGAQARLVALGLSLGLAEEMMERDPAAARQLVVEARQASGQALAELRDVVRGIHPPVLADRGLPSAVHALTLAMPLPVQVESDLAGRLPAPVESAGYFATAEALANVVKHSAATRAWVRMSHSAGRLSIVVTDNGGGGADGEPTAGTGLRGIRRRLAAFDGALTISSPPGGPTLVRMELPCESLSPKTLRSSGTG